jgi:iron complex transport system substrate-binding protein
MTQMTQIKARKPETGPSARWLSVSRALGGFRFPFLACLLLLAMASPLAARPQRVVSQSVGTDELLLALAEPGQIAALSHISHEAEFSPVAAEARRFPALRDSDAESVLRFRPDLVLAASYTRPETLALLRRAGVRLLVLDHFDTLEDVYADLRLLGRELGREDRAEALIAQCRTRVGALATRLQGVRPVRVLSAGLYPFTAGAGTTFQDLCEHTGALNVAAEAGLRGHAPTPSEKLLVWRVEVLVVAGDDGTRTRLGELPLYRALPAYRAGRVVALPGPLLSSVSHHRIDAYEALARALHPERFR